MGEVRGAGLFIGADIVNPDGTPSRSALRAWSTCFAISAS